VNIDHIAKWKYLNMVKLIFMEADTFAYAYQNCHILW
jgi:hypothetical protein